MPKRILGSPRRGHEVPPPRTGAPPPEVPPEDDGGAAEIVRMAHGLMGRENPLDLRIVERLRTAPARYRDLKPLIEGRSENHLTVALDRLEDAGLVERLSEAQDGAVIHHYVLTELGGQVAEVVDLFRKAAAKFGTA